MGRPYIYSWQTSQDSYVANVFYKKDNICTFRKNYIQPQLLSSHINLGIGDNSCKNSINFHLEKDENNDTIVKKAFWVS